MEQKLLHPIVFKTRMPIAAVFIMGFTFVAGFAYTYMHNHPDFSYMIQRQPIVATIENYDYKLRGKPETKSAQSESITYQLPGEYSILPGARFIPQTFNNCGPATVSMVLQYFGHTVGQDVTKQALRTNSDDKNVFTYEMADYLRKEFGIESKLLYNGDSKILKTLITNGVYVVVEDWLHPNEDIGHVTILRGYDDKKGAFIADDSYLGTNIKYSYEEFDKTQWKAFNREYLPVYTKDKEGLVKAIVGKNWDEKYMYEQAVAVNRKDTEENSNDMYAWFNLGTSYFGLGKYEEAKEAFEKSQTLGWPKRMLWYQIQPIQTYNHLGEYKKALGLTTVALWANDSFAEVHYEAAVAYKGLGEKEKARQEAQKALHYDADFPEVEKLLTTL